MNELHNEALAVSVLLRAMRELEQLEPEDEEIIIDSESNLTEMLEAYTTANILDAAHVVALENAIKGFKVRAARKEARIERRKGAILSALEIIGRTKKELAMATLSVSAGRSKIIITDEGSIPDDLCGTRITRVPDLDKIEAALKAGENVPGVVLSNSKPTLRVYLK